MTQIASLGSYCSFVGSLPYRAIHGVFFGVRVIADKISKFVSSIFAYFMSFVNSRFTEKKTLIEVRNDLSKMDLQTGQTFSSHMTSEEDCILKGSTHQEDFERQKTGRKVSDWETGGKDELEQCSLNDIQETPPPTSIALSKEDRGFIEAKIQAGERLAKIQEEWVAIEQKDRRSLQIVDEAFIESFQGTQLDEFRESLDLAKRVVWYYVMSPNRDQLRFPTALALEGQGSNCPLVEEITILSEMFNGLDQSCQKLVKGVFLRDYLVESSIEQKQISRLDLGDTVRFLDLLNGLTERIQKVFTSSRKIGDNPEGESVEELDLARRLESLNDQLRETQNQLSKITGRGPSSATKEDLDFCKRLQSLFLKRFKDNLSENKALFLAHLIVWHFAMTGSTPETVLPPMLAGDCKSPFGSLNDEFVQLSSLFQDLAQCQELSLESFFRDYVDPIATDSQEIFYDVDLQTISVFCNLAKSLVRRIQGIPSVEECAKWLSSPNNKES